MSAIIEARRKDIEALVEANKAAYEGMQALVRKKTETLTQAMQGIQEAASGSAGGLGLADPAKQAELARNAYTKALADMRDLVEIARKSQTDAMASITKRANEHLQEIRQMMQPQPASKK